MDNHINMLAETGINLTALAVKGTVSGYYKDQSTED
jgi:hypothetical protein